MAAARRIGEGAEKEPILRRLLAGTRYAGGELQPVRGGWGGVPRFAPYMSRWTAYLHFLFIKGWTFLVVGLFFVALSTSSGYFNY
jgi:hypothetical protein